jgi:hypothetical protein
VQLLRNEADMIKACQVDRSKMVVKLGLLGIGEGRGHVPEHY